LVSGEIQRSQVEEALAAGASDFLIKPFTLGELQTRFNRIIANLEKGKVVGIDKSAHHTDSTKEEPPMSSALFERMPSMKGYQAGAIECCQSQDEIETPAALTLSESTNVENTKQATLLVVDDVPDNIHVLVGYLQQDYKVLATTSGAAALKILNNMINKNKMLPSLILLDIMMPEMDGFEVCKRIKSIPILSHIPIIFLTAVDDQQTIVHGFELGAVDYVTKPANPVVLKARVKTHVIQAKAFESLKQQHDMSQENMRLHEEVQQITRHDLKNPIGGIINFTDLMLSDKSLTADQRDMLSTIEGSARLVLNMINLSLDMAKIEQGTYQLQPTPIDLIHIVRRTMKDKSADIKSKKLRISGKVIRAKTTEQTNNAPTTSFTVIGDEILCYSLFGNVIKNAIESAPENSDMAIAYQTEADQQFGSVSITNTGVVPLSIRDRFFDKFSTAEKKGGTGIGTYSAKLLTEVQHGTISMMTSDEKNETTITISLPLH
jgi:DNA-binding response OmpR family regulator